MSHIDGTLIRLALGYPRNPVKEMAARRKRYGESEQEDFDFRAITRFATVD